MKFSIIVPMHNSSQKIAECVESIQNQTYKDFECFLIDDGSTDNTAQCCQEQIKNDARFKLITQENKGVSAARNKGLEYASGDYIVFVDSDDWTQDNLLEELSKNADGQIIQYGFYGIANIKKTARPDCGGDYDIKAGNMAVVWRHALPRLKIDKIRFDEALSGGEDYLFLNQALKAVGAVKTLPLCLYNHDFGNKHSIMNNANLDLLRQQVEATQKTLALYNKNYLSKKDKKAFKARQNWCKGEMILQALGLFDKDASSIKKLWRRVIKKIVMILAR